MDEGYGDSLYDSGEDDLELKVVHPANTSGLPIRKSKLTKAEQKQFALWKLQVDTAMDAEDPNHFTSEWEPHVGGEDWE